MSFCYLIFSVSVFCTALISAKYTAARDVSQNEGLKNFYTALGGQNWLYRKDDVHWVFEEEVVHDPCAEHWAGYSSSTTCLIL